MQGMKKKNIYISLYVLIPLIYTGITMIGVILTYELFKHKGNVSRIDNSNFIYVIIAIAALTLFISFIVLSFVFRALDKIFQQNSKDAYYCPTAGGGTEEYNQRFEADGRIF